MPGLLVEAQHFIVFAENLSLDTQSGEISSLTLRRRPSSSTGPTTARATTTTTTTTTTGV
jgi:hypothetical protein